MKLIRLSALLAAALLAPFFCRADEAETAKWHEPVMVQHGENDFELLSPEESAEYRKKQKEREEAVEAGSGGGDGEGEGGGHGGRGSD